ncbi:hypothetical protein KR200_006359, partial [Drosophila serrata]
LLPSCLVVISGSLLRTANAEDNFESDRERVTAVYKDANPDNIGDSNVIFLVTFLDKYADQIQLTPEQKSKASDIVKQYNEDKEKQPLVDGAPPQGGWFSKLAREIVIQLGIAIASEGIKKATES